jgi:hypothetical protein
VVEYELSKIEVAALAAAAWGDAVACPAAGAADVDLAPLFVALAVAAMGDAAADMLLICMITTPRLQDGTEPIYVSAGSTNALAEK